MLDKCIHLRYISSQAYVITLSHAPMEVKMIPGYLDSKQAAHWLGMSYQKFRRVVHANIPSVQYHHRGACLYRVEDLNVWRAMHETPQEVA